MLSLNFLLFNSEKIAPNLIFGCYEDRGRRRDSAWLLMEGVPFVCVLLSLFSVRNLFLCYMQLKVYDVLKLIFQFRDSKLYMAAIFPK